MQVLLRSGQGPWVSVGVGSVLIVLLGSRLAFLPSRPFLLSLCSCGGVSVDRKLPVGVGPRLSPNDIPYVTQ